jgi:DNA-binding response OmpR family regulator
MTESNTPEERSQLESPTSGEVTRVMIADDNLDHIVTTSLLLETQGYVVRGLPSGGALLAQFEMFRPHVVIVDIGLPGLTGYDVARALRANGMGAEVLLIALTGYDTQTDRMLSQLAGFDYHLVKPADPNSLLAIVRDYIAGNRPVRIHVFPEADPTRGL